MKGGVTSSGSPPPVAGGRTQSQSQVTSKGVSSGVGLNHKAAIATSTGADGKGGNRPGGSSSRQVGVSSGHARGGDQEDDDDADDDDDFNCADDFDGDGDGDDEYTRDKVKSNNNNNTASSSSSSSSSSSGVNHKDKSAMSGGQGPGFAMFPAANIHSSKGTNSSTSNSGSNASNQSFNNNATVSATTTSRVVMKPGQRPFVRAGGSSSRKPIPPQTTTT